MDRIKNWGIYLPNRCYLCKSEEESLNHLFFNCCFTSTIWRSILGKVNLYANETSWEAWLTWISKTCKGKEPKAKIGRLAFCATIYILWRERNNRIHDGIEATSNSILQEVYFSISSQINYHVLDDNI